MAHIHSLKLTLLANLSSNYLRSHREYMSSINGVFISEGGSSITPVFWSLSCEHLGVVGTNPSIWANERRTAEVKEIHSMSIFRVIGKNSFK